MGELVFEWPWWMHPVWAVLLVTGATATVSVLLPQASYATWRTPRYLSGDNSVLLMIGISSLLLGLLLASARVLRSGSVRIAFSTMQLQFLRRAYWVLLTLVAVGYVAWIASAASQGASFEALLSVVSREEGAVSQLKADSRPIGGVTTLTQFGPLLVVLGVCLRRLGQVGRWHYLVVVMAAMRGIFYAERLALLEVLIPALVVIGSLAYGSRRRVLFLRMAPLIVVPVGVAFFAVFEYFRSWVYYQTVVSLPFGEWVALRMLGYYVTSYNNSALLNDLLSGQTQTAPVFSVPFLYNAPLIGDLLPQPRIGGQSADGWWSWVLKNYANPEFTNGGSFLLINGEFGTPAMIVYWLITGIIVGSIYAAMRRGSFAAVLAYTCIFVGLLELPRFIYWIQGRSIPLVLGILFIAVAYALVTKRDERASRLRKRWGSTREAQVV